MGSQFTSMLLEGFPIFCIEPLTKLESLDVKDMSYGRMLGHGLRPT